jgi:hypothetical protein
VLWHRSLAFPNAEIKAPTQDWAFWMSGDNAGKAANDMRRASKYHWGNEAENSWSSAESSNC